MGFSDDLYAATYASTSSGTDKGGAAQIFYDKTFLETVVQELRFIPLGQRRDLPKGSGLTIEFFRWLNLAVSVSTATLTEGQHPNATALKGQKLRATVAEYGAFAQLTSLLRKSHIDTNVAGASKLFGEHAARVLDTKCKSIAAANSAMPLRADQDATKTFSGTFSTVTSTTVVNDTVIASNSTYGDANDDLNQSVIYITSGQGYGQARVVTDYVTSGGVMTVSPAFDVIPLAGDGYTVVSSDALASGDDISYTNLVRARTMLKNQRAPKFQGGYYAGIGSPDAVEDILNDTNFINAHTYKDSMSTGLFTGEVGRFAGVRIVEDTEPFRFPITTIGTSGTSYGPGADGANYSATGDVESFFVLGRECFGVTTFKGQGDAARMPRIIIKTPGENSTDQPLNRFSTVGWVTEAVYKGLNPLFGVQIWRYAS